MSRIFLVKYGAEYNSEPNWQGCKGKKQFPVSGDNLMDPAMCHRRGVFNQFKDIPVFVHCLGGRGMVTRTKLKEGRFGNLKNTFSGHLHNI